MVNRVWSHHFEGLVSSLNEFGLRAMEPTHPELLDYLAWYFVENGWSLKTLHKHIVMSNTYQQTSDDNPRYSVEIQTTCTTTRWTAGDWTSRPSATAYCMWPAASTSRWAASPYALPAAKLTTAAPCMPLWTGVTWTRCSKHLTSPARLHRRPALRLHRVAAGPVHAQ